MEENKYAPLTEAEFNELIETLDNVKDHLPENKAPMIWNSFNAIRGVNETRPCTCPSAGAHWGRAVSELRLWSKDRR